MVKNSDDTWYYKIHMDSGRRETFIREDIWEQLMYTHCPFYIHMPTFVHRATALIITQKVCAYSGCYNVNEDVLFVKRIERN